MERRELCKKFPQLKESCEASAQPNRTGGSDTRIPYLRVHLTIQNYDKKDTEQSFIPENKHPISQNIQLWDGLLSEGFDYSGQLNSRSLYYEYK